MGAPCGNKWNRMDPQAAERSLCKSMDQASILAAHEAVVATGGLHRPYVMGESPRCDARSPVLGPRRRAVVSR